MTLIHPALATLALICLSSLATAAQGPESLAGTVPIAAEATDNVGVVGVQFLLDGAPLGPEDLTAPYSLHWDTTGVPNGSYTLTAVARDAAGNTGTSSPVLVTVDNGDTTPPSVVITAPISE
jgi:hypothetical protein